MAYPNRHAGLMFFLMMLLLGISFASHAQIEHPETDTDTDTAEVVKPKIHEPMFRYYRFGIDLSKFLYSYLQKESNAYEGQLDVHYKKDLNLVAEFGFGNSLVNNNYLNYKSRNTFVRVGLDKTFFNREFKGDLDNAFVGVRYAAAYVQRNAGTYAIHDVVWGNTQGSIPSASFLAHWLELTGGFRLELMKNIFIGWNVRVKTLINLKQFQELPPAYLAGYGKGSNNTAFGYNFYLLYGFGKR